MDFDLLTEADEPPCTHLLYRPRWKFNGGYPWVICDGCGVKLGEYPKPEPDDICRLPDCGCDGERHAM